MSLWIKVRNIKSQHKELSMTTSGGKYNIYYKSGKQRTCLKNNITDEGYANYLFDMFVEDLNMNKINEDYRRIYDAIGDMINRADKIIQRINSDYCECEKCSIRERKIRLEHEESQLKQLISRFDKILEGESKLIGGE